jgi:rubrerythrin
MLIFQSKAMLNKAIILTLITSLLSACVTGPDGYLKKSANNKIFDRDGFKGGKRSPLYNKRYITQAKKNVLSNNLDEDILENDDDEFYEEENSSRENIEMYKAMIDEDLERERKEKNRSSWWGSKTKKEAYPSVVDASKRISPNESEHNEELREELDKIKSMLHEAKKDIASYKCPTAKELERKAPKKPKTEVIRPRETLDRTLPNDIKSNKKEKSDAVHSI